MYAVFDAARAASGLRAARPWLACRSDYLGDGQRAPGRAPWHAESRHRPKSEFEGRRQLRGCAKSGNAPPEERLARGVLSFASCREAYS